MDLGCLDVWFRECDANLGKGIQRDFICDIIVAVAVVPFVVVVVVVAVDDVFIFDRF